MWQDGKCSHYQQLSNRSSSVNIDSRLRAGRPGFDSHQGDDGIFFYFTASGPALESTQPPIQWVPGALSPGGKVTWACRILQLVMMLKLCGAVRPLPQSFFTAWCSVQQKIRPLGVVHKDNFTFTFYERLKM